MNVNHSLFLALWFRLLTSLYLWALLFYLTLQTSPHSYLTHQTYPSSHSFVSQTHLSLSQENFLKNLYFQFLLSLSLNYSVTYESLVSVNWTPMRFQKPHYPRLFFRPYITWPLQQLLTEAHRAGCHPGWRLEEKARVEDREVVPTGREAGAGGRAALN